MVAYCHMYRPAVIGVCDGPTVCSVCYVKERREALELEFYNLPGGISCACTENASNIVGVLLMLVVPFIRRCIAVIPLH